MPILLAVFAAVAGALASVQAGTNSTLGRALGRFPAGLVSLAVSMAVLGLAGLAAGQLMPATDRATGAPWWAWLGGLIGAVVIAAQLFVAEQLGSALFAAVFVTATVATSVVLDHFGLAGFKQHPATWLRVGGIALMIAGVAVVSRT